MHRSTLIVPAKQALPAALATVTRALGFIACTSALSAATWTGGSATDDFGTSPDN